MSTQINTRWFKAALMIITLGLLTACGFHLRGAQDVAENKRTVYFIAGNASSELTRILEQNMRFNGIVNISNAPLQLQIVNYNYQRRAATINSSADVDEYELSIEVRFRVNNSAGEPLTSDIEIQQERFYEFDTNAAAASSQQETQIRQELHQSMAQTILRRYLSLPIN